MNEKTKEIYSKMSFYEKVQLKKQRSETALIDKIRGEEPKRIDSDYQANIEYVQGGF